MQSDNYYLKIEKQLIEELKDCERLYDLLGGRMNAMRNKIEELISHARGQQELPLDAGAGAGAADVPWFGDRDA